MALPGPGDALVLLHNPRCSKSRATCALLEERGASFGVREYLNDPLSAAELLELAKRLGKATSEWVRKGEGAFSEAGLAADSDEEALLDAMARHPILMERPIAIAGSRAVVGRPPENVLDLLG